jgi:hypothetical protein
MESGSCMDSGSGVARCVGFPAASAAARSPSKELISHLDAILGTGCSGAEEECSICLDPLLLNVVVPLCRHRLHRECAEILARNSNKCPQCRRRILYPLFLCTQVPRSVRRKGWWMWRAGTPLAVSHVCNEFRLTTTRRGYCGVGFTFTVACIPAHAISAVHIHKRLAGCRITLASRQHITLFLQQQQQQECTK